MDHLLFLPPQPPHSWSHTDVRRMTHFHSVTTMAKILMFGSTFKCFASPLDRWSSICTALFSCATVMNRSPASLWAHSAMISHLLNGMSWLWGEGGVSLSFSVILSRTVIRSLRERRWERTPLKACCHWDPSRSESPRRLTPVSSSGLRVSMWSSLPSQSLSFWSNMGLQNLGL